MRWLSMPYDLRPAKLEERSALAALIARSARELCAADYTAEQIEAMLGGVFGVDSELIRDQTYFAIEHDGQIVACGGWSRRTTLFGGDALAERNSALLDPETQAARVRAFFVDPAHARQGLGKMLLDRCAAEAQAHGFKSLELMATLTGRKLYSKFGFVGQAAVTYAVSPTLGVEFVPMRKSLAADPGRALR